MEILSTRTYICACFLALVTNSSFADPNANDVLNRVRTNIPKLSNSIGDRLPLLIWEAPDLPNGLADDSVQTTQSVYLDRGLLPLCNRCVSPARAEEYLPIFRYWKERKVPVCILPVGWLQTPFIGTQQRPSKADHLAPAVRSPDFPCAAAMMENALATKQSADITRTLTFLKENAVDVRAVFVDFESGLYLRNKYEETELVKQAMAESAKCPNCIAKLNAAQLNDPLQFSKFADKLRSDATRMIFTESAQSVFPDLAMGNFFCWPINRVQPTQGTFPAYGFEDSGLNVLMPRMYLNAGWGGAHRDQSLMNWNAFHYCLAAYSPPASVRKPGELLIPWSHTYLGSKFLKLEMDNRALPESWVMAEMTRHMMLRGAETFGIYINSAIGEFPPSYPNRKAAAMGQLAFNVKGIQEGYNDMLAFNEFLRESQPMTFDVNGKPNQLDPDTATWSGVQNKDAALVRTISFQKGRSVTKTISAFGLSFRLSFDSRGRNWWLYPDGTFKEARANR